MLPSAEKWNPFCNRLPKKFSLLHTRIWQRTKPTKHKGAGKAYPVITANLSQGSVSNDVTLLKKVLVLERFLSTTTPNSIYNASTTKAISLFQTKYKIATSGTPNTTGFGNVGPKTCAAINQVIAQGK